ncbi:MAG TPA: permease-like cell division protein FtsX [Candidatus Saccharimonadia bacterium]|nr:permease-like cell division protein FtsX [Candidatus Saccharimonadia bacterium]
MLQFWRIIQAGSRNFLRNMWLSTAATAVMTVTLTIVVISFISNSALTSTIKGVTDKIDVSIFLSDSVTPQQRDAFKAKLESDSNVTSVSYKSKADALADYRRQNAGDQKLLEAISETDNPLPASFQIKTRDPNKLDSVTAIVNQPDNKALLDPTSPPTYSGNRKTTIDRIVRFSNFFKTTGLVLSIIFVIISTLIIFNTIRMAIFTRRDEIEIMKLVGATKWFIRGPFLFEAALYGIIAALIAAALSFTLLLGGGPKLGSYIDVQSTIAFFRSYPVLIVLGEMIIGIIIGTFSSLMAMSRYLKL